MIYLICFEHEVPRLWAGCSNCARPSDDSCIGTRLRTETMHIYQGWVLAHVFVVGHNYRYPWTCTWCFKNLMLLVFVLRPKVLEKNTNKYIVFNQKYLYLRTNTCTSTCN